MQFDLVIQGGKVVFPEGSVQEADLAVREGKIAGVLEKGAGAGLEAREVVAADGLYVFPGVVDPHQHMGIYNPAAEDFDRETAAAALGGTTTIVNYYRGKDSYLASVPPLIEEGERLSRVDFALSLGLLRQLHLEELELYARELGVTSYKFYRNYQDNVGRIFAVEDPLTLDGADELEILRRFEKISVELVLCVHCEDMDIQRKTERALRQGVVEDSLGFFAQTSPDYGESVSLLETLYLRRLTSAKVYVVHLSAARSVRLLEENAWLWSEGVTVETCPHYLVLDTDAPCGLLGKVNPPIREAFNKEVLWEGLRKGIITAIGSDNCPSSLAKKYGKGRDVWNTLPGFPGSGAILPLMLSEGYHKRGLELPLIARATSAAPARALGLWPQKGNIAVGADADLVLVDLDREQALSHAWFGEDGYSVYDGLPIKGWPVMTIGRGEIIAREGKVLAPPGRGRYLRRRV
ncbi:MAG: amidohydrolase family protein [Clostridia bacterium]|nr:amidohydrolase family protein [Clostridia bacterium]